MEKFNDSVDTRTLKRSLVIRATQELKVVRQSANRARNTLGSALIPRTSHIRLDKSSNTPCTTPASGSEATVLYLAYGSNLCAATFRGVRGIKPLSQVNVVVPALSLTFDLAGTPYNEPCFANTARRVAGKATFHNPQAGESHAQLNATAPLLRAASATSHWDKGLVGVVYEVTLSDYTHIIATEGGGLAYNDIMVDCHPLSTDPTTSVPMLPSNKTFKAHTLFAPAIPDSDSNGTALTTSRIVRPQPNYAEPSARYLNLITTGAAELALPDEYRSYLSTLQCYNITTKRQEMGKYVFVMTFGSILAILFGLVGNSADPDGSWPDWVVRLGESIFSAVWWSYDEVLKKQFGDGERTLGDDFEDGDGSANRMGMSDMGYGSVEPIDEKKGWDMV